MERVDGYLDLNKYYNDLKKEKKCGFYQLLVDGYIIQSAYDDRHFWLKINEETFYFKPSSFSYREILAYHIATLLGYDACYYDLAMFSVTHDQISKGVISKSYKKENANYISGTDCLKEYYQAFPNIVEDMGLTNDWEKIYDGPYIIDMNNLEIIWQALEFKYGDNPNVNIDDLMENMVNRYIFAILLRTNDLGSYNWELEEHNGKVSICPLIDNELIFYNEKATTAFSTSFKDSDKSIKESIKLFLTRSSEEYVHLFIQKFNEFNEEMLLNAIMLAENQINQSIPENEKKEIIENYKLNQKEIKEVLEELNLVNKGR